MRSVYRVALLLLVCAPAGFSQATTAQVVGRVTDPSGAAVIDADLRVTNVETGLTRQAQSNETGGYVFPALPPGEYRVGVVKDGFKPVTRTGLKLTVNQTARIDFLLELGAVAETVEVTANAGMVEQDTSALGQVIDSTKVSNIPLNGRNPFRLVQLTTNVLVAPSANGQFADVPVNTLDDSMISINGGRARTNEVLIDGIPSTTGFVNQMTTIPNPDSTQEFKVQSNNLSAEWGRFGGGVINVSTRSGSNQLHGSLYEYLRNSAFDANEFFNRRAGNGTPAFRMNQFGYSVGGPVVIPGVYKGTNKTFFFTDYQGTRWRRGDTFLGTVPTELQRKGDFTQTLTQRGQQIVIYDPDTTRVDPANPARFIRTAFPGNVLPASRINPIGAKMAAYYPLPNTTGDPLTGTNNFVNNAARAIEQANFGSRVDHNMGQAWRMFGRFSVNRSTLAQPDTFGNPATSGVGANGKLYLNNYNAGFDNTVTLSPSSVFNVRYGFARFYWARNTRSYGFDQTTLGIPASLVSQMAAPLYPNMSVEGFAAQGGGSVLRTGQDTHTLLASLARLSGKHNFKFGLDIRLHRMHLFNLNNGGGNYAFNRTMSRGPDPNAVTETGGSGLASLLLGTPTSGSINLAVGNTLQNFYYAGYLQDDFRVSSRLTLNLGVRWEAESPMRERRNQINFFDVGIASPVRNSAFPNLKGGLVFADESNRQVYAWDKNNFAPRGGFAWSFSNKMVIRGGGGLFFAPFGVSDVGEGYVPNSGFTASTPMVATIDGITPFRTLTNSYADGLLKPTRADLGASTYLGQGVTAWDPAAVTPYTVQWNLDIQRSFGRAFLVEAAYSGSRGVKLNQTREYNALDPRYLALGTALQTLVDNPFYPNIPAGGLAQSRVQRRQLLLPYPQYSGVSVVNSSSGNSVYHSLALKGEKRMSKGYSVLLSYTLAKLISDTRNSFGANGNNLNTGLNTGVQNWYDLRSERSLSEIDAARSLAVSFVAELPFGGGKAYLGKLHGVAGRLVSGWQLSGVVTSRSGFPLVLSATIPNGGNRPNSTGVSAELSGDRSRNDQVTRWFNTSAFTQPAAFTFGNVSRTLPDVRGPAFNNIDVSLLKNTRIREGLQVQFRAEYFNVLNHANFWQPNSAFGSQQFGQLNTTTGLPRVGQLALKILF
ncbi:MAG: carboxypeptidase-like regulatory domain-containing protein [Bryobacteraceae bacterium]|nr:carboxypeptidase-like regulatory domain-containing protein [Bryobacteraceae bacterium]